MFKLGPADQEASQKQPRVLLIGYNGANNTGAEAKLLAIIDDMREVFGPKALLTIPSLNPDNLRRYVQETPYLRIVPVPSIYFATIRRLVREHDIVVLTEGSTYMDTWSDALLWLYLWTTKCADDLEKPCIAYAVDSGHLSRFNKWLVRREASKTDLIVARNRATADNLREWGVTAPITVTADNAFYFRPDPADNWLMNRLWPETADGVIGLAPVNFHQWPVKFGLWGPKEECYRWPYYFSHSPERREAANALAEAWAEVADKLIEQYNKPVALFCMEELDEPLALKIREKMKSPEKTRIFSSREYNASQMTSMLRGLDLLVTSRYHACVLSLAAAVPQIAVGHDQRLKNIYSELGIFDKYFIGHNTSNLVDNVLERAQTVLAESGTIKQQLRQGYLSHLQRSRLNRPLLYEFVEERLWNTVPKQASPARTSAQAAA
jgi:polysaccharide pyruvyl transferase WcaK-like protein